MFALVSSLWTLLTTCNAIYALRVLPKQFYFIRCITCICYCSQQSHWGYYYPPQHLLDWKARESTITLVVRVTVVAIRSATIVASKLDLIAIVLNTMCASANSASTNTCNSNGNQLNSI